MIQHFVLIYAIAWNGYTLTTGHVYFASFDLCRSAQVRLQKEFEEYNHFNSLCVPTEEKHK